MIRKGGQCKPSLPRTKIKWQVMAAKCESPNPAVDFLPTLHAPKSAKNCICLPANIHRQKNGGLEVFSVCNRGLEILPWALASTKLRCLLLIGKQSSWYRPTTEDIPKHPTTRTRPHKSSFLGLRQLPSRPIFWESSILVSPRLLSVASGISFVQKLSYTSIKS